MNKTAKISSIMLIKKIKQITHIDAFDAFKWIGDDFKKYGLIYGWNGSGKTTISRIFNFLERKDVHIDDLKSVEFSIETDASPIKQTDITSNGLNVKVFNEDFITENLSFEDSQAKKIVILGKENVTAQQQIEQHESNYQTNQNTIQTLEEQLKQIPNPDDVLTQAGREVPKQFTNTPLGDDTYYGRSYNKLKVDKRLETGVITEANLNSLIIAEPSEVDSKKEVIKNEKTEINIKFNTIEDFEELFDSANGLLNTSITFQNIEGLKEDGELKDWIEAGYKIHKQRGLKECQFCKGVLPDDLLVQLGGFFTDELQKAKLQIQETINLLAGNDNNEKLPELEPSLLFPEPSKECAAAKKELSQHVQNIQNQINLIITQLKDKQVDLHNHEKKHEPIEYPREDIEKANESLKTIEKIVSEHNIRVQSISEEVKAAAESIELHTIASILENKNYFKNKSEVIRLTAEIEKAKEERNKTLLDIKVLKASLTNASDAVDKINSLLKEFFGESLIYLEVNESDDGEISYILKRRGKDAKHLSEGEESVLALVYFLIKLEENDSDKANCLVVLDDPVDSQDSIFLFRTAGLIKRHLKDVGQLIVLTHNFDFFNLIRDWLMSRQYKDESNMFLITHDKESEVQEVKIENLPNLLKEYKSEYQYLFCRLYQFAKGTRQLDEPLVANIARKILEYFAGFKWSCATTEEFNSIVMSRFVTSNDDRMKGTGDFIVKFLHEYSHGQDFSRGISASMLEAKPIALNVLKFIELADEDHYSRLETICTSTTSS